MRCVSMMSEKRPHTATRALVIYESDHSAFATVHPVRTSGPEVQSAGVEIGPATAPLTLEALTQLVRELSNLPARRPILPGHILYSDGSRMAWHRPAARRLAFFHTGRAEFDRAVNGKEVLYPPLLFLATPQSLHVWALASNERPEESTPVYRAPVLNVYDSGHMCNGTSKLPLAVGEDTAPFERAFFETTFTHSNVRESLTAHPGGHDGLWRALADPETREFRVEWLKPLRVGGKPLTVGEAVNR